MSAEGRLRRLRVYELEVRWNNYRSVYIYIYIIYPRASGYSQSEHCDRKRRTTIERRFSCATRKCSPPKISYQVEKNEVPEVLVTGVPAQDWPKTPEPSLRGASNKTSSPPQLFRQQRIPSTSAIAYRHVSGDNKVTMGAFAAHRPSRCDPQCLHNLRGSYQSKGDHAASYLESIGGPLQGLLISKLSCQQCYRNCKQCRRSRSRNGREDSQLCQL